MIDVIFKCNSKNIRKVEGFNSLISGVLLVSNMPAKLIDDHGQKKLKKSVCKYKCIILTVYDDINIIK